MVASRRTCDRIQKQCPLSIQENNRSHEYPAETDSNFLGIIGGYIVRLGLSLRRDILPENYVDALQNLQDHIAGFDSDIARSEIEQALRHIQE